MLTISTTPEIEELVQSEAAKRGLKAEEYALNLILGSLPQPKKAVSDEEFDAALDELMGLLDDVPFGTKELRALKEEEMALEEAKFQRHFGKGAR